jgi:hypothetical protein
MFCLDLLSSKFWFIGEWSILSAIFLLLANVMEWMRCKRLRIVYFWKATLYFCVRDHSFASVRNTTSPTKLLVWTRLLKVFCMAIIRLHLPGGETSPTLVWTRRYYSIHLEKITNLFKINSCLSFVSSYFSASISIRSCKDPFSSIKYIRSSVCLSLCLPRISNLVRNNSKGLFTRKRTRWGRGRDKLLRVSCYLFMLLAWDQNEVRKVPYKLRPPQN